MERLLFSAAATLPLSRKRSLIGRILFSSALVCACAVPAFSQEAPDTASSTFVGDLSLPDAPRPQLLFQQEKKPSTSAPPAGAPTLDDLGITPEQSRGDTEKQALLDKRTHMLKVHQRLGLITAIPITAACIAGAGAVPDHGNYNNTTSRDVHVGIAGLAIAMYGATAYYAAAAPRVADHVPAKGGVKLHKYLIYIHAPGMVLTPILGYMAFNQDNSGQRVHGIAAAHSAVALTTAIAYGASILAVSYPIHLHF